MDSHAVGETTPALLDETIGACLTRTVGQHADHEALVEVSTGRRWTWAELDADVRRLAKALLAGGTAKGDRVGIWAPNCAEWTIVQLATARIGAVLVTINPAYRTHELAFVLNQAGISHLFLAESFKTSDYVAMLDEVRDQCTALTASTVLGGDAWDDPAGQRRRGRRRRPRGPRGRPSTPTTRSTSSTRRAPPGFPKGATLSHRNILNNGWFVGEVCRYTHEDRICIPVPFYHCFGMVMGNLAALTHGATMVIPAPGFDPALTLAAVSQERCTSLYGVPTMFIAEWALPDFASYDLSTVRTGIMAGSPVPRRDDAQAHRRRHHRDDDLLRHDRDVARSPPRPAPTTTSTSRSAPSAASAPTWRSRSSTRSPARRCRAARRASWRPRATR